MTAENNTLAQLFAACWKDEALKIRFISGPKTVLKEHDLETPEGMQAKVSENAYDCVHITMPMPPQGHLELADEELIEAAGGSTIVTPKRNDTYSICTPGMMQQRSA